MAWFASNIKRARGGRCGKKVPIGDCKEGRAAGHSCSRKERIDLATESAIVSPEPPEARTSQVNPQAWSLTRAPWRRLLAAAMLGTAVFLVQAGVIEIVLRADRICQEARLANWAYRPRGCQAEPVRYLIQGLSRGFVGAVRPNLPPAFGVLTMAAMMAVLAGLLGLLRPRQAVPAFLMAEVLAAFGFGMLGFMLVYLG